MSKFYRIGEVSKKLSINISSLRIWIWHLEKVGYLFNKDKLGRLLGEEDVEMFKEIKEIKSKKFVNNATALEIFFERRGEEKVKEFIMKKNQGEIANYSRMVILLKDLDKKVDKIIKMEKEKKKKQSFFNFLSRGGGK